MNSNKIIIAIGEELKSGFFLAIQKECKIDHQKICNLWDQYYEINSNNIKKKEKKEKKEKKNVDKDDVDKVVDEDDVESEEKPNKKTSGVKNKLTSPTTIPQGKTSAIPRRDQTSVQFSDIDKLKVAELKNLNKERGLPISGNKAILTDALKSYERAQGVVDEDANDEDDKTRKPSKKKSEKREKGEKEETKDKITIVKKKKSDKSAPPVIALIKPEELKSHVDQYGKTIVADDLVCEDETRIIIAFKKFEDDTLYKLDTEHMEKCKELNLEFRIEEDFEP